jgi:hypothetical protein
MTAPFPARTCLRLSGKLIFPYLYQKSGLQCKD